MTVSDGAAMVIRWVASVPITARYLLPAIAMAGTRPAAARELVCQWAARARALFGIDLRVVDENGGRYSAAPYLFLHLNQASHIESCLYPAIPASFRAVVNAEYAIFPLVGWVQVALGAIVVVRQWRAQGRYQMARAEEILRRGENVAVSIEGHRSRDGTLGPYKKSPLLLGIRAGATIVPFLTLGARDRLPYGDWRVRPGEVTLWVGPSIETTGLTYADRDRVAAELREWATRTMARHEASARAVGT
ncbi:MAG: lysophospholipid acyltransferase family protein [Polyangiales bacterium]